MTDDNISNPEFAAGKQSGNIIWIDIAKFIGITLVIFHHASAYTGNEGSLIDSIARYINLFHMPLFFILAGYLYKNKGIKDNYKKTFWALLIPYLIYQFLFFPFKLGEEVFYNHAPFIDATRKLLSGIITGDVIENSIITTACAPLWFLVVMIQLRIIFTHINISLKNGLILIFFSLVVQKILLLKQIDLYFCLDITLYAIPYFIAGYWLKKYSDVYKTKCVKFIDIINNSIFKTTAIIFSLLILYYILEINGYLHLARYTYSADADKSLLLFYIAGFSGTWATCLFSGFFSNENRFVKTIAKNTLFVIYFHWQLLFFLKWFGVKKLIINYLYDLNPININGHRLIAVQSILICCIIVTVNLLINYAVIKHFEKKSPIILGKYGK